jgi:hypothetical protein
VTRQIERDDCERQLARKRARQVSPGVEIGSRLVQEERDTRAVADADAAHD